MIYNNIDYEESYSLYEQLLYEDTKEHNDYYKILSKARIANLDKWGKDADHNILYITGYSGSGKSTLSHYMAKPGDTVISLDGYCEDYTPDQNQGFNKYLDKNFPDWRNMSKVNHSKKYIKLVYQFCNIIEIYAKEQFSKGHRVIAEGTQIIDGSFVSEDYYKDKPLIILGTSAALSIKRISERDGSGDLSKDFENPERAKDYALWFKTMNKNMNNLALVTNAKCGNYL